MRASPWKIAAVERSEGRNVSKERDNDRLVTNVLTGAVAGAAATWLMGQATTWMYAREDERAKRREEQARGGVTALQRAAEKAADAAGIQLSTEQRRTAGQVIHWVLGAAGGAFYQVARRRQPSVGAAFGLPFGLAFFLAVDELMNPLLGLTPGPQAFPWQAHARGLGGHLVYGAATDLILQGLDRVV
jgi:hypothetical protein